MKLPNKELPEWMAKKEDTDSLDTKNSFLVKNANRIANLLKEFVDSAENGRNLTAGGFINLFFIILFLSISDSLKFVWLILLWNLFFTYKLEATVIVKVFKRTAITMGSVVVIMSPMLFFNQHNFNPFFLIKTIVISFIVISRLTDINFNSIIIVLRKFKCSNFIIFIVTMMILYLKVLAVLLNETIVAITLRSFGKLKRPYYTTGGLFGGLYLASIQLANQVYEAMVARGFTGNYVVSNKSTTKNDVIKNTAINLGICLLFVFI